MDDETWHKQVMDFDFDGHLHAIHHICIEWIQSIKVCEAQA